jgi:Calx-beta domain
MRMATMTCRARCVIAAAVLALPVLAAPAGELPVLFPMDAAATESARPGTFCRFEVRLDPPSALPVAFPYATFDGTARAGVDYQPLSGTAEIPPGATSVEIRVPIVADGQPEDNEFFSLDVTSATNARLARLGASCTIVDDDALLLPGTELSHGTVLEGDIVGGAASFRLAQAPRTSYELVLDAASGSAVPGMRALLLGADNSTVTQSSQPVGTGAAVSLRWQNLSITEIANQTLLVRSGCLPACAASEHYRVRAYDTTYRGGQFDNTGGQSTVLVIQNLTNAIVRTNAWFWRPDGTLLLGIIPVLPRRGSLAFNLPDLVGLQGQRGSITLTHNAAYGALAAKAVTLDPATGFAFDSVFEPRPH